VFNALANIAINLFAALISERGGDMMMLAIVAVIGIVAMIRWHRAQRAMKKLGMASLPFIVACFVVALIAIGGGAYGLGLKMSAPPATAATPASRPDTRLRLRLDPCRHQELFARIGIKYCKLATNYCCDVR
jgi:hypothetical protein